MEYFTIEEDSEVEEFVAEDPNYKRKIFWFDLTWKAIDRNCRRDLAVQALIAGVTLGLECDLIFYYVKERQFVSLAWTVALILFSGTANLLFRLFWIERKSLNRVAVHEEIDLRHQYYDLKSWKLLDPLKNLIRSIFAFILISPIFTLFDSWVEAGKNAKDLRRPLILRSQPQPSISEIQLVEKSLEASLRRIYTNLVEVALKFIPFGLGQVFIYIYFNIYTVSPEEVGEVLDLSQYGIRAVLIFWSMVTLSYICGQYAGIYQNYSKALQFGDLLQSGIPMNLKLASTGVRTIIPFLDTFFSVAFRLYALAVLMSTVPVVTILVFLPVVYFSFHLVVMLMPTRSRLRFENAQLPPDRQGLSSKMSDMLSRWINLFCSHDIKYECHFHLTFVFIFAYALIRIPWLASAWTNSDGQSESYEFDEFGNSTTIFEFAQNCQATMPPPIPAPILNMVTGFAFEVMTMTTLHCSPRRNLLQNDFGVGILFGLQYSLGLIHMLTSKTEILFGSEFPARIGYRWWGIWLSNDLDTTDMFQLRKTILSMILPDEELLSLTRHFRNWSRFCFRFRKEMTRPFIEAQMDKLWEICERNARVGILSSSHARLDQLIERRRAVNNSNETDIKLNKFLEFATSNYDLDAGTVLLIIFAVTNFDTTVQQTSSRRLTYTNLILQ